MTNFLLVHGTSHGGWCWKHLSPLLQAAGHDVYTPTLTGLGASSHLLPRIDRITLATHIEDVTNTMFYEDLSEVVLVFTPHPISTYEDPPPSASSESAAIPRTFVHCTVSLSLHG